MDCFLPILCIVAAAQAELDEFGRYPAEKTCQAAYMLAGEYARQLDCHADTVGGWPASQMRERAGEARQRQGVWLALWWINWPCATEVRREWIETLRGMIGDEAFVRGEWPEPLPGHHFSLESNVPRTKTGKK